ncbi:MAG: ornithine cyclodeaminase family protein, partial [Acidimicrobiales bacterium]
MTDLRVLNGEQVDGLLDPVELRAALTSAMIGLSNGLADVPPRVGTTADGGLLLAMPGYLKDVGLVTKLISVFPGNVDVPSHQGVIVLFGHDSGTPLAVLDAEVISGARTAMTAAIAADELSRSDASVLAIVGGGAQAISHAKAFATLRPWTEVRVVNRSQPAAVVVAAAAREAGAAAALAVDD